MVVVVEVGENMQSVSPKNLRVAVFWPSARSSKDRSTHPPSTSHPAESDLDDPIPSWWMAL